MAKRRAEMRHVVMLLLPLTGQAASVVLKGIAANNSRGCEANNTPSGLSYCRRPALRVALRVLENDPSTHHLDARARATVGRSHM